MATSIAPTAIGGAVARELRGADETRRKVVDRYRVTPARDGARLHCDETPGISVRIDASFAFGEADARRLGPRTILLDGAGQFAPLIDGDAKLYNLDHHQGCVRAFTLATCEQALVLVAKGLDLDRGSWTLYANEPDLDAVLAIWILLNHRRVTQLGDAAQRVLLPLVRLEGAIDAGGTETAAFCGLPEPALGESRARLDHLYRREQTLRALVDLDATARTAALLRELDSLVFAEADWSAWRPVEEVYGNAELSDELVAVACRDSAGIYDVEQRLRERWGARLGLVVLQGLPGKYTLRASGSLAGISLAPIYGLLNALDPAVDGRPAAQRWGGSDDIGGSPRDRLSGLTPERVLRAAQWVQRRPLRLVRGTARAAFATAGLALAVLALGLALPALPGFWLPPALGSALELAIAGLGALAASAWLARRQARKSLAVPGWRAPAGRVWLALVPLALAAVALGGAWVPARVEIRAPALVGAAAAAIVAALGVEAWFRGWVHGLLLLASPPRASERPAVLSPATAISGALYAAVALMSARSALSGVPETVAACAVAGLALGIIRERSLSIWPGIAIQLVGAALAFFTPAW